MSEIIFVYNQDEIFINEIFEFFHGLMHPSSTSMRTKR